MRYKLVFALIIISVLLLSVIYIGINMPKHEASNPYPVHNLNSGLDYATIQEAIDANQTLDGHTILVDNGTYYGQVTITKALRLVGEDAATTIVNGSSVDSSLVRLVVDNITVTGFTISNCGLQIGGRGVYIQRAKNCNISGNIIESNYYGAYILYSSNISLSKNNFTNNNVGIFPSSTGNNTMLGNSVTNNQFGIELISSSGNIIAENEIKGNSHGIRLYASSNNNTVYENNVTNNAWSIEIARSIHNKFYHNNFIDNAYPASSSVEVNSTNVWDDGYPSGGNYWSDYTGVDANGDGIGDTPYQINVNNTDNYPLVHSYMIQVPIEYYSPPVHDNTIACSHNPQKKTNCTTTSSLRTLRNV